MAELKDWQIGRLKCWGRILSDESLVAPLAGDSDNEKGKSILLAMKEIRALDQIQKDGRISEAELKRLHDADVLADAANRVAYIAEVDAKWLSLKKDEDGQIERLKSQVLR